MSRSICIQATYLNHVNVSAGVHNSKNAELSTSLISAIDMQDAITRFKENTKGKKYKNLCVHHNVSDSKGMYYHERIPYQTINQINAETQLRINQAFYYPEK